MDIAIVGAFLFFNARIWTLVIQQEIANRKASQQIDQGCAEIAAQLDQLQTNINSLRFDMARCFYFRVVESSLVVQPLMIEENKK